MNSRSGWLLRLLTIQSHNDIIDDVNDSANYRLRWEHETITYVTCRASQRPDRVSNQ